MIIHDLTGTPVNTSEQEGRGYLDNISSCSPMEIRKMTVIVTYRIMVLVDEGDDVPLEIRVNRDEDIFQLWLGEKQVAFGDWTSNLLLVLEEIVHTEKQLSS